MSSSHSTQVEREVLSAIDRLREQLVGLRAFTPRLDKSLVGHSDYQSAGFYAERGHHVAFVFAEPLTDDDIDRLNANGQFINQSYLVLLCSVLEFHHVLRHKEPVDGSLDGNEHVKLLRDLRNVIAHRIGQYDPENQEHKKLFLRLHGLYRLKPQVEQQAADAFPLPIDEVLLPMTDGCRAYAQALLASQETRSCSE